jgi:transglutaminase/protease-like cytokinesis protein 3
MEGEFMKSVKKFFILIIILGATCGIAYKDNLVRDYKKLLSYTESIYGNKINSKLNNGKKINDLNKMGNNVLGSSTQSDKQVQVDSNTSKASSQEDIREELTNYKYTVDNYNEYYNIIKKALENFQDSVSIKINKYNSNTYNLNIINKVLDDYYDIDYGIQGASGTIYSDGGIYVMKIDFKYKLSRNEMINMRTATQIKAKQIISKIITPNMNSLQRELAIHDYIVNNTTYDYDNYVRGTLPEQSFTDYGVLVLGRAVCEGYSKAMFRLLNMAGVQCYVIKGTANGESHAWNIVNINGNYTQVDATFDDPVTRNGKKILSYSYFDLSDSQMSRDHQWDINKYPRCNTTAYNR